MRRAVALAALAVTVLSAACGPDGRVSRGPRTSPTPTAAEVSFDEARAAVDYEVPDVGAETITGELTGLFLRPGDNEGGADAGMAVEYRWPGDLTLVIDPTLKGYDPRYYPMSHGVIVVPNLKGDYDEEPRWALRTVRDRPAVGVDPTEDHYSMLSWSDDGVFFTFQSPTHQMDDLIEVAESLSYPTS